ncbi:MAG TPA: hypothetical protein VHC21_02240 [Candidatus Saccharimonadales bacterium]|nr:hypothetical protein [Candidatus Saccharimonadales bacterium]
MPRARAAGQPHVESLTARATTGARQVAGQNGLWDKIWRNRQGEITIWQTPNVWIIAWAVLDVVAIFAPSKSMASVAWAIGSGALVIWALLEIFRGANYFRRALGLLVLLVAVGSIFKIGL